MCAKLHFMNTSSFKQHMRGMTLIECLVAAAISGLLLAGLSHVMTLSLKADEAERATHERLKDTMAAMRRIAWSIEKANRKRTQPLNNNSPGDTKEWLDEFIPATGVTIKRRYMWNSSSRTLQEEINGAVPIVILNDVSFFSMQALNPATDNALITYTITTGDAPDQVTLTDTRRLGGPW